MAKINEESLLQSIIPIPILTNVVLETRDDNGNHLDKISSNNPHVQEENNAPAPSDGTKDLASINIVLQNTFSNNSKLPYAMAAAASEDPAMDPKNYFSLSIIATNNLSHLDKVSSDEFIKKYIKEGIHDGWLETYSESLPSGITAKTISLKETSDDITDEDEFKIFKKYKTHDPKTNMEVLNIPYEAEMFFEGDLHLIAFVHINGEEAKDLLDINYLPDNFLTYGPLDTNSVVVDGKANNTKTVFFRADRQDEIWNGPYQVSNGNFTTAPSGYPLNKKEISNNIVSDMRNIERVEPVSLDFKSLENNIYSFLKYNFPKDDVKLHHNLSSYISPLMMTTDKSGANKLMFSINFRKMLRDNTSFALFLDADAEPDTQKLILDNSPIQSIRITRRRIKEKKIDNQSSAVGTVQSAYQSSNKYETEDNEVPLLIVSSRDAGNSLVEKSNTQQKTKVTLPDTPGGPTTTSTINIKVGDIKELVGISYLSDQNLNGVRHFYVTDAAAADILGGEYQYSIELVVKNGAKEYIKNRIQELKNQTVFLKKYYNMAVGSSVAAGKTTVNYNILYQKFTQTFIDKSGQKPSPTADGSHWQLAADALGEFTNMMQIFYSSARVPLDVKGNLSDFPQTKQFKEVPESLLPKQFGDAERFALYDKLTGLCSPQSGSPRGIESSLNMISTFIDTMSRFMGENISSNKQGSTGASNNIGPSKTNTSNMIIFHHDFNNLYSTSINKHIGYDCLRRADEDVNSDPGNASIKNLTIANYDLRSKEENYKFFHHGSLEYNQLFPNDSSAVYNFDFHMAHPEFGMAEFKLTEGEDPETNAYSFLTPSYIHSPSSNDGEFKNIHSIAGTEKTYILQVNERAEKYKKLLLQIVRANLAKSTVGSADVSETTISSYQGGGEFGFNYSTEETAEAARNVLKAKELLSSENCTVEERWHDPILRIPHNKQMAITKNSVKYIEKKFQIESEGATKEDIKTIPKGDDYDDNGQFILKISKKDSLLRSKAALELLIMKGYLPTKHLTGARDSIHLYNLKDTSSWLYLLASVSIAAQGAATSDIFSSLPNQIKSLIHAATGPAQLVLEPSAKFWGSMPTEQGILNDLGMYAYYHFNYKTIFMVQALTGFENNGDVVSPVWASLTPQLLDDMRDINNNSNSIVFCRLVTYHAPAFGAWHLPLDHPMYVPLYDEYFTIQNTQTQGVG